MTLTREQILESSDLTDDEVEVPEWGGTVKVRGFTKRQQRQFVKDATVDGKVDEDRYEVLTFIHGVTEPKFSAEDYEALLDKSATAMNRVLLAIARLSGADPTAVREAEKAFRS